MFSKFKKWIIGFFVLAGGILFAFLSGKSAGRKKERLGGLNKKIKETKKSIKKTEKKKREVKKSLESKKKNLDTIKKKTAHVFSKEPHILCCTTKIIIETFGLKH